jgi:hypothetical protein
MFRRLFLLAILAALATALFGGTANASAAVQDPERNATTPTSWHIWVDQTKAQIDQLALNAGERVVDVNVTSTNPLLFSAVMVKNTGVYARTGGWSYGTEADVTNTINAQQGRLIDLDPINVNGQRRFAFAWVKNVGDAAKGWHWNYDLTVDQVTNEINQYGIRLIDLDTYVVNGQQLYSYIGIANQGVDGKAWWWWPAVTPQFTQQQATANHARLIAVGRPSAGLMAPLMQSNGENAYWRYVYDYSLSDLLHFIASNGLRITDFQQYVKNGNVRYAATMIDNASSENQRIRGIWRSSTMANAPSGNDAWFGIYAKEVAGPVDVALAQSSTFNPLSVLKLVPHLYVMDQLDNDPTLSLLDKPNGVTWTAWQGQPDKIYCPYADGNVATQVYSDTLRNVLKAGLWNSNNRAHESLVNKYGPTAINGRIHQLGLEETNVYPGCAQPPPLKDWHSNTSTLTDLGKLFENVDTKVYFPQHWAQVSNEFYGLMADWSTASIKTVVADEAAKVGKSAIVNQFMSHVTLNGKGGGTIIPQANGTFQGGRSFFGRLELPFVTGPNKAYTIKTFVGGYFVDNFSAPCNEDTAMQSADPACTSWKAKQDAAYALLTAEPYRLAIRKALVTWPAS